MPWLKPVDPVAAAPVWHVCFTGNFKLHWWDRFLADGFRHVHLLGYLPGRDAWLFYDVGLSGTTLAVVTGEVAGGMLQRAAGEGGVLSIALAPQQVRRPVWQRLGFWCVPAALHLLGYRCVAITPKGLHDKLLKLGARPFPDTTDGCSV